MKIIEKICMAFFVLCTLLILLWIAKYMAHFMGLEELTKNEWAAWVQAIGSVMAIIVAILLGWWQTKSATDARHHERETNRKEYIVRITHHLLAVTGDLIQRVSYSKQIIEEGGRPLIALIENSAVIEKRFETYFDRDVYSCLSGSSIDLIVQMCGSIFGICAFSKSLASLNPNALNEPMLGINVGKIPEMYEKLIGELNLLDSQIRNLRETYSY